MNFFIKMNIKNEQRRQEKCDAGQRKSNHNCHCGQRLGLVAYKVVGTYEVFSTQHERKEVGHESPAYGSRQRGVRRVAGGREHENTSMDSKRKSARLFASSRFRCSCTIQLGGV